jgi:hypothetical protein
MPDPPGLRRLRFSFFDRLFKEQSTTRHLPPDQPARTQQQTIEPETRQPTAELIEKSIAHRGVQVSARRRWGALNIIPLRLSTAVAKKLQPYRQIRSMPLILRYVFGKSVCGEVTRQAFLGCLGGGLSPDLMLHLLCNWAIQPHQPTAATKSPATSPPRWHANSFPARVDTRARSPDGRRVTVAA